MKEDCFKSIPSEMKRLKQWVCVTSDSKVPLKPWTNEAASSTNPATWGDYETAVESVIRGYYDNIGFVFANNGLVGIDIDTGYDDDGFISEISADIIGKCASYTETSRSGRGFHILLKGELPFKGKNNLKGVEIYKSSRYFIMTGHVFIYQDVIENQEAIDYVINTYFPSTRERQHNVNNDRIYTPIWDEPITGGRVKLRPTYPSISIGNRNLSLTSLAGMLHNQGYSKRQIYDELLYVNRSACELPLNESEIQTICNSVTRYKR